ncbi:MAG: 4-hydroxy-3-methylbut-2-enyl diphosphate reductase, partial [Nitrospinota bacterium]
MRVKLAKSAGFCWGVERAIDIVLDKANSFDGPVYTHGPVIHNPQTIELLKKKNVHAAPVEEWVEEGTLVIRAHGIAPEVREQMRDSGAELRDATCPLVARVHGIIRKHA